MNTLFRRTVLSISSRCNQSSGYGSSYLSSNIVSSSNTISVSPVSTLNRAGLKDFFEHDYAKGTYPLAGRSWAASDLRHKSFEDLHKLWFVLLKERNKLLSEKEMGKGRQLINPLRLKKVRKSMAAIKCVLGERDTLRKKLYIVSKCKPEQRKKHQIEIERLTKLVGAVALSPGLKDLENFQDSLLASKEKFDQTESALDKLENENTSNKSTSSA
eukprot:gene3302-4136_t